MPELGFRYVHSTDGTDIAYAQLGSGPPLVVVPPVPFSNIDGDWALPLMHDAYTRLAADLRLLLYDGRGTGASRRDVADLGIDAQAADLAAVLDDADVERTALLAMYLAVPPAVTYAAAHPERISHVILFGGVIEGRRALERPGTGALLSLIDEDWELFTRTAALDWMGWGVGETGEQVARSFRSATTPAVAKAALSAYAAVDLAPMLGDVAAPTLILHRRHGRQIDVERSTELATALPDGRLQVLEGESATLFFDDPDGTVDVISEFVHPGGRGGAGRATSPRPSAAGTTPAGLTVREQDVLRLIAAGETNAEIAHQLGVSVHTVERHAANIYRKIDARGRADATAWAIRNGLG